ncbi:helix-turn-helix transcriptional regulator, partial [Labilibacter sediminis]
MPQIKAVYRAITLVEENLCAPLDVAAMATASGYSLYYFCRIFGKFTRHSPHDYLIRRRITEAARTTLETQQKIVDIAFEYQFNSHEGFTRAFSRILGLSPTEVRSGHVMPA